MCPRESGARREVESAEVERDDRMCRQRGVGQSADVGGGGEVDGQIAENGSREEARGHTGRRFGDANPGRYHRW